MFTLHLVSIKSVFANLGRLVESHPEQAIVSQSNLIYLSSCNLHCCNSCPYLYALVGEIKLIYLFYLYYFTIGFRAVTAPQKTPLVLSLQ